MDQVEIIIPRTRVNEGSAFTATAYFRDRATSLGSAPATAKYRVDNLTTGQALTDWTTLTPATSIQIPVTATHNAIQSDSNERENVQLTVAGDVGLSTQVRNAVMWSVENLFGST